MVKHFRNIEEDLEKVKSLGRLYGLEIDASHSDELSLQERQNG